MELEIVGLTATPDEFVALVMVARVFHAVPFSPLGKENRGISKVTVEFSQFVSFEAHEKATVYVTDSFVRTVSLFCASVTTSVGACPSANAVDAVKPKTRQKTLKNAIKTREECFFFESGRYPILDMKTIPPAGTVSEVRLV